MSMPVDEEGFYALAGREDACLPRFAEAAPAALAQFGGASAEACGALVAALPGTAEELLAWTAARAEAEMGPDLVHALLGGLACARAGLSEQEAAILLARATEPALPRRLLSELTRSLAPLLRPPYEGGYTLELANKQVRRAVARSLLSACPQNCGLSASGAPCRHLHSGAGVPTWAAKDAAFHRRLASTFLRFTPREQISSLRGRAITELRFHIREGLAWDLLAEQTAGGTTLRLDRALAVFADPATLSLMLGTLAGRDGMAGIVFAGATPLVTEQTGAVLAKYIASSKMLRTLAIRNTAFAEPAQEAVFGALGGNKSVGALELDAFAFEPKGPAGLKLSAEFDAFAREPRGAAALAASLKANAVLKTLTLSSCRLSDAAAGALGEGLSSNGGLAQLTLAGCTLSDAAGAALLASLASNKVLKRLEIRATRLGPAGVRALGEGLLRGNKQLAEVAVEQCGIDSRDPGVAQALDIVGDGLGGNEILLSFSLSGNLVGSRGLQALVRGVRRNRTLESLRLAGCGVESEGAGELATLITEQAKSFTLQSIDLSGNAIGRQGLDMLQAAKANAKALQTLNLEGNVASGGAPSPSPPPTAGAGASPPATTTTSKRSHAPFDAAA
eukprot:tig00020912_g15841.t1